MIVEAKGGSSTLAMTRSGIGAPGTAKQVQQLSKNWILHKLESLKKAGHNKLAVEIEQQINDKSLDVLLVSTPIAATKVVESPEFIMKNISQIANNSFF